MFRACPLGEARLSFELSQAEASEADIWWRLRRRSGDWLGEYFAFWRKTATKPCDQVKYEFAQQRADYPLGDYGAARFGEDPALDGSWSKASIVHASPGLLSDDDAVRLYCGVTNYNFSHHWAEENFRRLLEGPARPSVFGIGGRLAFPGIGVLHALICTSDGYIVFSLRSTAPDFYKLKWSASFEEQIRLDKRDHVTDRDDGDRHVLDSLVGGLDEEFGITINHVAAHSCLAIGRTYVDLAQTSEMTPVTDSSLEDTRRMDLHCPILAAVQLNIDVATLWSQMMEMESDRNDMDAEAMAWVGVRFPSLDAVDQFLANNRDRVHGQGLFAEATAAIDGLDVQYSPLGEQDDAADLGLMPTTAARLYLGGRWLASLGCFD